MSIILFIYLFDTTIKLSTYFHNDLSIYLYIHVPAYLPTYPHLSLHIYLHGAPVDVLLETHPSYQEILGSNLRFARVLCQKSFKRTMLRIRTPEKKKKYNKFCIFCICSFSLSIELYTVIPSISLAAYLSSFMFDLSICMN